MADKDILALNDAIKQRTGILPDRDPNLTYLDYLPIAFDPKTGESFFAYPETVRKLVSAFEIPARVARGEITDLEQAARDVAFNVAPAGGIAGLATVPKGIVLAMGAGTSKQVAKRLSPGKYTYKEFDIMKDGDKYRFRHPSDESYELSADTLDDAKAQIDDIFKETFGEALSNEKTTSWLQDHGYDPYVGIGPRPKTSYYEFTEDGAIKTYTPYRGNKSGVEVKTFRNPTHKQLRDWMGYKSGGRVERNPYNYKLKAI